MGLYQNLVCWPNDLLQVNLVLFKFTMGLSGMEAYQLLIHGSCKERGFGDPPTPFSKDSKREGVFFYIDKEKISNFK